MKKLTTTLCTIAVVLLTMIFVLPTEAKAATYGDLTYSVSDGEVEITDCASSATNVKIPATIEGYPVTTIGRYAFCYCTSLQSVTIPDSVTTIGDGAFESCTSLQSVTIPDSVTTIGHSAFDTCYKLQSVTIPDSVTTIGDRAFYYCNSLQSVTIGDSVTTIGDRAFYYCYSLQSVEIPDSVTTIGDRAFEDCYNLQSVTIPDSVTTIGDAAFSDCYELTGIWVNANNPNYSNDAYGVLFNKDQTELIQAGGGMTGSYTVPNTVTTIGNCAFWHCTSLQSVTIPNSVTTIGNSAFSSCNNLQSVTIGDSVTTIGESAFSGCENLQSVSIGDSVTTIGDSAFSGCDSLTSVEIPDSVTTIGYRAFYYCTSLQSVTIPDSVTTIGSSAFRVCDSLKDVYYTGSEKQWNSITIDEFNEDLLNATIHYNYGIVDESELVLRPGMTFHSKIYYDAANPYNYVYGDEDYLYRCYTEDYSSGVTTVLFVHNEKIVRDPDVNRNLLKMYFAQKSEADREFLNKQENAQAYIEISKGLKVNDVAKSISGIAAESLGAIISTYFTGGISGADQILSIVAEQTVDELKVTVSDLAKIITEAQMNYFYLTTVELATILSGIDDIVDFTSFRSCEKLFNYAESLDRAIACARVLTIANTEDLKKTDSVIENLGNLLLDVGKGFVGQFGEFLLSENKLLELQKTDPNYYVRAVKLATYLASCEKTLGDYGEILADAVGFAIGDSLTVVEAYKARENAITVGLLLEKFNIAALAMHLESGPSDSCDSHNYQTVVTPSSCTENGYTTYTCKTCGISFVSDFMRPQGHKYAVRLTKPTCVQEGYTTCTCKNCGYSYKADFVPKSEHNYVNGVCAVCSADTRWRYTVSNGAATITGYEGTATIITIPSSIGSYPVTTIGAYAFSDCTDLTGVIIPNSVTVIGNWAFNNCTSLKDITIPDSVTHVGIFAFNNCCNLTGATVGKAVATIGESAFSNCSSLINVNIPASVSNIGNYVFSGCGSLRGIWVEKANPYYSNDNQGVLYNKNKTKLIRAPGASASISVPSSVTSIGISAFSYSNALTNVTIPSSVTAVGDYAFFNCTALTDVCYMGTQRQWGTISIGIENGNLIDATIHYGQDHLHAFSNYVSDNNATCTEQGTETAKCDRCDVTDTRTENIPVKGHTAGEPVEEEGFMVTYCSVCGEEMSREEIVPEQPEEPEEPEEPAKDPIAEFNGEEFDSVAKALKYAAKNGGGIVKLTADATEEDIIVVKPGVKLDLAGFTMTALDSVMAEYDTAEIIDSARVSAKAGGQLLVADTELFLYESNEMMPVRRGAGIYEFAQLVMRTNFSSNFTIGASSAQFQVHYRGHNSTKETNKAYFQDLFKNNNASDLNLQMNIIIEGTKVDGLPGRFVFGADESQIKTLATNWKGAMTVKASGLGALSEYDIYVEFAFVGVNGTTVATHDYVFSYGNS